MTCGIRGGSPRDRVVSLWTRRPTAVATLGTYLGHIDVKSTQRYLKMTPELLHEPVNGSPAIRSGATVMIDKNLLARGSGDFCSSTW